MKRSGLSFCILLVVSCRGFSSEQKPLFSKGINPLVFRESDFPLHPKTQLPMRQSADCAPCHKTAYKNWSTTRHRVAFTNELYQESHAREPSPWCVNCHAPLRLLGSETKPHLANEGISCLVCHVREGKILAGEKPKGDSHSYAFRPEFKDERLCENCHEFNFPTAASAMSEGGSFRYTAQPMQSTVSEYRASAFFGKVSCVGCHVFPGTSQSHLFPGGHALNRLKNDLRIEVTRENSGKLVLRLFAQGVGHALPTGDLFRALRVKLSDVSSNHAQEVELRHFFEPIPAKNRPTDAPLKTRVREEVLPPPNVDYISMREYFLDWPRNSKAVVAELYIDYLSRENAWTTALPARTTRPLIKRQKFRLAPASIRPTAEG